MKKMYWKLYKFCRYLPYNKSENHINNDIVLTHRNSLDISKYVHIETGAKIYGNGTLSIKENTIIGPNLTVYTSAHDYRSDMLPYNNNLDRHLVNVISENVWIGGNVLILPGVTIGEGAVVGAGTVVSQDVEPLSVVVGNPARVINKRSLDEYNSLKDKNRRYLEYKFNKYK